MPREIVADAKFRGMNYQYDANGRMTFAERTDHINQQTSVYDCAGQRVQTTANGVTRTMVYDVFGQNVADYTGTGPTLERENIYRGGLLLAIYGPTSAASEPPFTFTDDPLVVGSTVVKAVHLNELRTAVNQARTHAGLSAATWTDDPAQATVTTIKAVHITELRARLDEARTALGLPSASYTDPALTSGYAIKVVHVQELRARTNEALTVLGSVGGAPVFTYLLTDVQGSTRAAMNNNGVGSSTVVARHDYLPFGEEIGSGMGLRTSGQRYGVVNPNRWKYGLTDRDAVSGLDHTWWRKYENRAGRWTTPDPIKGVMPQSLNAYTYAGNDPVNSVDPSGLCAINIRMSGTNRISAESLTAMQNEITRIFRQAGQPVNFGTPAAGPTYYMNLASISASVSPGALGSTRVNPGGSISNYGAAYVDRIIGSLESDRSDAMRALGRHPVNLGTAIGRVVAHEVGHFLFQLSNAGHTRSGLMRAQFRGDSSLFLQGSDSNWRLSLLQIGQLMRLMQQCRQQNTPLTTNPTPIITVLPGGGPGGDPGPRRHGGGDPFDVFRWLDVWIRSNGGYGEVVDYEIGALVP